jgi:hypothetical protein
MHHDIVDMMKGAGNLRQPATVVQARIRRFADLKGMTMSNMRASLLKNHALPEGRVDAVLEGRAVDGEVAAAVCALLNLYPEQLNVHEMEESEEVTYLPSPAEHLAPNTHPDWSHLLLPPYSHSDLYFPSS